MPKITQRGGWRFEHRGGFPGELRVCVRPSTVAATNDKTVVALGELCSPWFSLAVVVPTVKRALLDVQAELKRLGKRLGLDK